MNLQGRSQLTRTTPRGLALTGDTPLTPSKTATVDLCLSDIAKSASSAGKIWPSEVLNITGVFIFLACHVSG